ncbi:ChpI protein [Marispirochaeta sp.]|jgi:metal-responsive CopG/Arc/MetJ family transcriptional regulator|uniref:ChpI protein n=1 Tax=Marispirochaeta sp. TaxID=2038653 RepID=UPI0029C8360C|nr:ChpI protein [Marispirochaeta sp.]
MKTAISIPDNLFSDAEITAKQLGLARSQLYVRAIKEFIEHHNKDKITEQLNMLYTNAVAENELLDAGIESIREATKNDTW